MSRTTGNNPLQGVTWFEDNRELMLVLFAVLALLATVAAAPLATSANQAGSAGDVGVLGTSMVEVLDHDDSADPVSLDDVRDTVESSLDNEDYDGSGVDVALIDTGVAPVAGLDGANKVLHGPDLSMEGSTPEVAYLDTYGHGTHMAGIIAGNRAGEQGVAPGARLVSLKVAGHDGLTTVPQVVAAIDWVVEHRNSDGLNIRVLNLSLGQAGVNDHVGDELSAAVERAWSAGIFVVVAAGNDGENQPYLDSPAVDPYVLAVGAEDTDEEQPAPWSGYGDGVRNPNVIAPGRSIASYRVPGSTIDLATPSARYGADLFLGSGTSQAAAVVSGAAALILQAQPQLSPDELKATIERNAEEGESEDVRQAGHGRVDAEEAEDELDINQSTQSFSTAAGVGTGILAPTGATWSGGTWSGATWSGATWSGTTWSGATWSGATWSGATWSGATWSGATWSGATWSGATWSGATWSGATWSGATWSGATWS